MDLIITIIIVLFLSNLFALLAKKIKIPIVVALILNGLFLGFPLIKNIVIDPNSQFIFSMGDIALLGLMFLAGLESSWKKLNSEKKDSIYIGLIAALTPLILGLIVFKILGFSLLVSFIIGICMSITSEATKARVLLELKKLRTKVGAAMMGAGIVDDILGLSLFILITYLLKTVYLKEDLLITGAIFVFFIGIFIQKFVKRENPKMKLIERFLLIAIVPFFFIALGIHFNINSLLVNPFLLLFIIAIAIIGKIAGTFLTKPFTKLKWKQLYLIGWAMNSRGAIELALALIAFRSGLIHVEIYSSLVIMALVTTLMFPFIITKIIKKYPKIMN